MKNAVLLTATFDTKGEEALYIKECILSGGSECITLDSGVGRAPAVKPDIGLEQLCALFGGSCEEIWAMSRGEAVALVSGYVERYVLDMYSRGEISCVAGIGGAGGTQIVTQMMRALPFGIPKYVLTTLASGNTKWYLMDSDIVLMPSIADVAGINCVSRVGFDRFAAAAAASAAVYSQNEKRYHDDLHDPNTYNISMTMYGTTTKGVTRAKQRLEKNGFQTLVFHASGAGGMAMERFIRAGTVKGVYDSTLAEIGGHFAGGLHDAGDTRLSAAAETGIPQLIVPGAADTVVLPPKGSVPERFKGRILNMHNPTMTTMRTDEAENILIGNFIADKLLTATGPSKIMIPMGGLSSIDKPGLIFYFPAATEALIGTLEDRLKGSAVEIIKDARHIDDPGFGEDAAELLSGMMKEYYKI